MLVTAMEPGSPIAQAMQPLASRAASTTIKER